MLRRALLVSLGLHLLAVWMFVSRDSWRARESGDSSRKLHAVITTAAPRVIPMVAAPVRKAKRPWSAVVQDGQRGARLGFPAEVAIVAAPVPRAFDAIQSVPLSVTPPVAIGDETLSERSRNTETRSDAVADDGFAEELRQFRLALALGARRFRMYPASLRERGVGGRVEIEVTVLPSVAPMVAVRRSSGYSAFDDAALNMVGQSLGAVRVPALLSVRRLNVVLPIEFIPPE